MHDITGACLTYFMSHKENENLASAPYNCYETNKVEYFIPLCHREAFEKVDATEIFCSDYLVYHEGRVKEIFSMKKALFNQKLITKMQNICEGYPYHASCTAFFILTPSVYHGRFNSG